MIRSTPYTRATCNKDIGKVFIVNKVFNIPENGCYIPLKNIPSYPMTDNEVILLRTAPLSKLEKIIYEIE